ncbi:cysteine desulfurase family protein [Pelagibius sp. Alg239-R121]|uniref:cysteine desulfurase family protein n=1 Tax=Pelagibius sp. Alg239-R121 TaxID=2993448 RepID=UPI0024A69E0C|nr:cysteine desulfurase family protein [Pelagibius sp. Alg239-R121]
MAASEPAPKTPIYLDYQATTPTDPRVVAAMQPFFSGSYGNPHSTQHAYGREAEQAIEAARAEVANLIGARPGEVIFTSGATEANNLAFFGALAALNGERRHLITLTSEHPSVLACFEELTQRGYDVTILPVDKEGLIDCGALEGALRPDTALMSVMAVNNEIGVLQPLEAIGALCAARGILFHCDAAQAVGKLPLDVKRANIDLLSLSGHKLYGPKGIGALYVGRHVRMKPVLFGGGQERGLRSGTLPTPLCVGLGHACRLAQTELAEEVRRLTFLREHFLSLLAGSLEGWWLNGSATARLPGNINLSFELEDIELVLTHLDDLALSTGSACSSETSGPSHVLTALGLNTQAAHNSLRIGFGRFTSQDDVEQAARRIAQVVSSVRSGEI